MKELKRENYNMILIDKLEKYQYYTQVKLINVNIYLPSTQIGSIKQTKFTLLWVGFLLLSLKFTYSPIAKHLKIK